MHFSPRLLSIGLGLSTLASAAVRVNILINDKHLPTSVVISDSSREVLTAEPTGPFYLRAVSSDGRELVNNGMPLYLGTFPSMVYPPLLAVQARPRHNSPEQITLSQSKLRLSRGYGRPVGVLGGNMVSAEGDSVIALGFTVIYSKSASCNVLAIKQSDNMDGNPDIFMLQNGLDNLSPMNLIYACIPEAKDCSKGKTKVYLKVEEITGSNIDVEVQTEL